MHSYGLTIGIPKAPRLTNDEPRVWLAEINSRLRVVMASLLRHRASSFIPFPQKHYSR